MDKIVGQHPEIQQIKRIKHHWLNYYYYLQFNDAYLRERAPNTSMLETYITAQDSLYFNHYILLSIFSSHVSHWTTIGKVASDPPRGAITYDFQINILFQITNSSNN